ncbi:MAG: hypothetical protein CVV27_07045 [Candidatus Melainabacteria bacterium HGW-Melainabacteria-1]|nr:MAG: hypothetical protein CVV27_07045 [Candidatus Melainabacteria bacterium HGW-Melainabacteria-1]
MLMNDPLAYLWLLIMGMMIGSFLNVLIYRTPALLLADFDQEEEEAEVDIPAALLPRFGFALNYVWSDLKYSISYLFSDFWTEANTVLKGISFPGSHCGSCQHSIAWYDNLPVISWFVLGGKCRNCHQPYSLRYPAIEALTGGLFVYVLWLKGLTPDLLFWMFLVSALWAIFWIDVDTQFIFNVMTYPSILLGILYNGTKGNLKWSLGGGLLAWCLFEVVVFLSIWMLQKEGMGGGDVKLAVLLGVWLGPLQLLVSLGLAFLAGSLAGVLLLMVYRQSRPFPFGPFLVLGGLASMAVGESLWAWYIEKSIG